MPLQFDLISLRFLRLSPCGRGRSACSEAECDTGEGYRSIEGPPFTDRPVPLTRISRLQREIRPLPQGER